MEKRKYVIVSTIVTDNVTQPDGTFSGCYLGGAGTYALAGIRLWTPNAMIVAGIGEDFSDSYYTWFRRNSCSQKGMLVKDAHTAVSDVVYQKDGERQETPEYGKEHYWKMEASAKELSPFLENAKGVYIFKDLQKKFWEQVIEDHKKYRFSLMWELNAEIAVPERLEDVRKLAKHCELISMNEAEAQQLFGCTDMEEVVKQLLSWKIPVIYLRVGKKGAYILAEGKTFYIPSVKNVKVADATGAGNSSTAAVLYGYCEGASPLQCGIMGSISAARCIEQYGPPDLSEEKMKKARCTLEDIMQSLKEDENGKYEM